ncbi:MAG TPA: hypothetical protein VFU47_10980, partial [Armatimonadota bacterium]|nr:hypothetical protein [Armatimonadota bacterium]
PKVIGSTSPIRIDGDGDGRYSSPLEYARRAVEQSGGSPERLMERLRDRDSATAVQAASVCRERGMKLDSAPFRRAVDAAAPQVRQGFVAYQALLAQP